MGTLSQQYSHMQTACLVRWYCYALKPLITFQIRTELALRKRCSFAAAVLKGLFRRRADALERQGRIIIVVVVRFDRDTAACLWKGAVACPIIQGSPYVVSLCSNDMSVHRTREPTSQCPMYFSLYRAFGASIGSLDVPNLCTTNLASKASP